MKKLSIIACMFYLLTAGIVQAQAQQLPSAGERTFEIGVSPFAATPVAFTEFRLRSFQSEAQALRLRANLDYTSERTGEHQRSSRLDIAVAPGMEWHFFQHNRLSAYYGAEVNLRYRTSRDQVSENVTNVNTNPNGFFGLDLNGLVGLDLHFLQRLYTGLEVGYGLRFTSYSDIRVNDNDIDVHARDVQMSTIAFPRFRLGLRF